MKIQIHVSLSAKSKFTKGQPVVVKTTVNQWFPGTVVIVNENSGTLKVKLNNGKVTLPETKDVRVIAKATTKGPFTNKEVKDLLSKTVPKEISQPVRKPRSPRSDSLKPLTVDIKHTVVKKVLPVKPTASVKPLAKVTKAQCFSIEKRFMMRSSDSSKILPMLRENHVIKIGEADGYIEYYVKADYVISARKALEAMHLFDKVDMRDPNKEDLAMIAVKKAAKDNADKEAAKPKKDITVKKALPVEDAKTYHKPKTLKISQEHFDILKPAIDKVVKENPDMLKKYKSQGLSNMRYNWDLFWKTKLDIKDWGLNDDHLNSALAFILGNDGKKASKDVVATIEKQPVLDLPKKDDIEAKIQRLREAAKSERISAEHADRNADRNAGLDSARALEKQADDLAKKHGIVTPVPAQPKKVPLTPEQKLAQTFNGLKLRYKPSKVVDLINYSTSITKDKAIVVAYTVHLYKTTAAKGFEDNYQAISKANDTLKEIKNTYLGSYNIELNLCTKEGSIKQDQDKPLGGSILLTLK